MRKVLNFKEYMDEQSALHGWPEQAPRIPSKGEPSLGTDPRRVKVGAYELAKAVFGRVPAALRSCYHTSEDVSLTAVHEADYKMGHVAWCRSCGLSIRMGSLELCQVNITPSKYAERRFIEHGPVWRQEIP